MRTPVCTNGDDEIEKAFDEHERYQVFHEHSAWGAIAGETVAENEECERERMLCQFSDGCDVHKNVLTF